MPTLGGGEKNCRSRYRFLERGLAASGRQRALYQYKYFIAAGRESFFSGPPAREDLLPVTCQPPPPGSEAAWGRGVAIFRANRGLLLAINICPVFAGAHSSLNCRPEWIFAFTGQVCYVSLYFLDVYFPVYLSPLPAVVKQGRGMGLSWGYWAGSVPLD
jgi:hypothetical protein